MIPRKVDRPCSLRAASDIAAPVVKPLFRQEIFRHWYEFETA
jgi:hypothetical protein